MQDTTLSLLFDILPLETWNTIYMVFSSAIIASLIGLPIAIILCGTDQNGLFPHRGYYSCLNWIVNIGRSFPFAILMVALIPFTRLIMGTSLGTNASIVPLSVAAAPFIARLFEQALRSVDKETIEATLLIGATPFQIIFHVLMKEALPKLILAFTNTLVTLIGYSTMVGMIGGGGLGKVAIQYGYMRFNMPIMIATVLILIILVQIIQFFGAKIARSIMIQRGLEK
jgi:D-methionine transport system permease protein